MTTSILDLATPTTNMPTSTLTPTGSSAMGKDEFLKLLVAQLANQDPTQPQDSTAFVAQLAQFSSLEQQQNTNQRLDSLLLGQATSTQTSAATFIGKSVTFNGGQVQLSGGQSSTAALNLAGAADKVTVSVSDSAGNVVRTLQLGAQDAGSVSVAWDGRDDQGNVMPDGSYTLSPVASSAGNPSISISATSSGTVTGVAFQGGVPLLKVGSSTVKMSDVSSLDNPVPVSTTASALQAYQQASSG